MDAYSKLKLLDEHEGLFLHTWNGDGERFVTLFRDTWQRLPTNVQSEIAAFCQTRGAIIELLDGWHPTDAFGQVETNALITDAGFAIYGLSIRFRAEAFACLPEKAAHWVIAHELAHVHEKARGYLASPENKEVTERRIDEAAKGWGFDDGQLKLIMMVEQTRHCSVRDACVMFNNFMGGQDSQN